MCWRTSYGMLSVPRIATKDIHVKKAFVKYPEIEPCSVIHSLFHRSFIWRFGEKYVSRFFNEPKRLIDERYSMSKCYVWEVCWGFHSAKEIEIKWNQGEEIGYLFVGKPMDLKISYYIYNRRFLENSIVIHNCIIPKGSKYYVNEYGEYVSDQLIVLPNQ